MVSLDSVRGRRKAIEKLADLIVERGEKYEEHRVVIGNTDAPELVAEMREVLKERFGNKLNLVEVVTNPTAGSHCGPNGLGLSFRVSSR